MGTLRILWRNIKRGVKGQTNWKKAGRMFKVDDYLPLPADTELVTSLAIGNIQISEQLFTFRFFMNDFHVLEWFVYTQLRVPPGCLLRYLNMNERHGEE